MSHTAEPKETREFDRSLALFLMIFLGAGPSQLLEGWVLSDGKAFVLSWMIDLLSATDCRRVLLTGSYGGY